MENHASRIDCETDCGRKKKTLRNTLKMRVLIPQDVIIKRM